MKEILTQLSAYHIWANQSLLDSINQLPEEKQKQEVPSSFKSLYTTLLHMYDAENIWWQRMKLQERINIPSENFSGDLKDLGNGFLHQNRQWHEWVAMQMNINYNMSFIIKTLRKNNSSSPFIKC
jgi:uncharacterized damage-inducible protein DinB